MARLIKQSSVYRHKFVTWSIFLIVFSLIVIPASIALHAETDEVMVAQAENNPRANYWREVRGGVTGYSAVKGQETDVLIQGTGQNWRQIRITG